MFAYRLSWKFYNREVIKTEGEGEKEEKRREGKKKGAKGHKVVLFGGDRWKCVIYLDVWHVFVNPAVLSLSRKNKREKSKRRGRSSRWEVFFSCNQSNQSRAGHEVLQHFISNQGTYWQSKLRRHSIVQRHTSPHTSDPPVTSSPLIAHRVRTEEQDEPSVAHHHVDLPRAARRAGKREGGEEKKTDDWIDW